MVLRKCWIAFTDVDVGSVFISLVAVETEDTLAWFRVGILRHMVLCTQDVSDLFV